MTDPDIKKGLAGVVVDTTAISKVNPETNSLLYRGYPVQQLAERCSFEQVAWLLWHGELPTPDELAAFERRERAGRALDPRVRDLIDVAPTSAHPMDVVRTAVSLLGVLDPEAQQSTADAELAKAERLLAAIPAIVAYDQRRRRGQEPVAPRDDLDYSRNFLWMTYGEEPTDTAADVFRISMVLYAEHSFNASTFTARVVTSTLADLHSAVVAAIGALKGPLHGGANEAVMLAFDEIGSADAADAWLADALAAKRKIMGFGHRVYKHGDSRVPTMEAAMRRLTALHDRQDLADLYDRLAAAMDAAKGIKPNLDYPSGPAYRLLGFDTEQFTPLFVASRVVGWTAHVMEQRAANALIRPLSAYVGPDEREVPAG
ncbi:bifunctional 2-methylcitrate synthase/citrate synthase [Amnibacterium sp.]|uniref:bifunctional 2-methylcitrate synthase/citrate synthase n=1 Tax=Amnibacterium sp. TaxID=1872496 RepID=UPI003F7CA673